MNKGISATTVAILCMAWIATVTRAGGEESSISNGSEQTRVALVRLSLDYIDHVLEGVAASTSAVAEEFVRASRSSKAADDRLAAYWREHHLLKGNAVSFQTWEGALDSPPPYQSDTPGWFSYHGTQFSAQTFRNLAIFRELTPAVRAAYRSYPYSWSYVTTADEMMMIYPFLTLEEAVNNDPPSRQTYYTHADFERRTTGWTPPYLDLVGAGMMVTASTPAYDGDTLLGVVSHDITLAQLSDSVLGLLARDVGGVAWIVDESGLVIAVSESSLESELAEANQSAGQAVLHYRHPISNDAKVTISRTAWINELTEAVLSRAESSSSDEIIDIESDGHPVLGGLTKRTGWLLIWKAPIE